jgi:hypothetical protein
MISSDQTAIFAISFSVACAVIYVVCVEVNLPLLTYHPFIGQVDLLWTPEKSGPAMYWYGWMLTSLLGASVLALIATAIPERWLQHTILFGCLATVGYLIVFTIALFIYDQASVELPWLQSRWLSAIIAAALAAVASCFLPASWCERFWPGWVWVVPLGTLTVLGYYLAPYFTH